MASSSGDSSVRTALALLVGLFKPVDSTTNPELLYSVLTQLKTKPAGI